MPHLLIDDGPTTGVTKITMKVVTQSGDPVPNATIQLVVENEGVSKWHERADSNGEGSWAWVSERPKPPNNIPQADPNGEYFCRYRAQRHGRGDFGSFKIQKNHKYILRVEVQRAADPPNQAMQRYIHRGLYPMSARSEQQIAEDLIYTLRVTEVFLDTPVAMFEGSKFFSESDVEQVRAIAGGLRKARTSLTATMELESFAESSTSLLKKAAIGVELVTCLYEIIDAAKEDDWKAAAKAVGLTTLSLVLGSHPITAPFWLGFKLGVGLATALVHAAPGWHWISPEVVAAVQITGLMKTTPLSKFSNALCDPRMYRVDFSTNPWNCKRSSGEGFAFDKGQFIYIDSKGKSSPMLIRSQRDVDDFIEFVNAIKFRL